MSSTHPGHLRARGGHPTLSTPRKVGLTALAMVAATAVATHGSDAAFTASVSRGHEIVTGTPALVLGATGAASNRLGIDVTGLIPGASAYRSFDITNTGTQTFSSYTLSTTVTTSSLLNTDATNGIQTLLERCSAAWVESGAAPSFTYTCSGTRTTVIPSSPLMRTNTPVSSMVSAAPGGTDHLLLTETLPSTADNTFQNLTSAVTYTFNAS